MGSSGIVICTWRSLETMSLSALMLGIILTALSVQFLVSMYYIFWHPLAGFPGPIIAQATGWYEFWHDVVKRGQYVYVIERMHDEYGPIVRLSPNELSIRDPEYYRQLYVFGSTRRTNIWPRYRRGNGLSVQASHTMTETHDLHHMRRKALEPFFSRQGIERIEGVIVDEAEFLDSRLQQEARTRKTIRLDHAFSAFAGDIIGRVCCETPTHFTRDAKFSPHWHNLLESMISQVLVFMHIPILVQLFPWLPLDLLLKIYPGGSGFVLYRKMAVNHIAKAKDEADRGVVLGKGEVASIFRSILQTDMPETEKSVERMADEAMILLGGGTTTTARTLGLLSYYVLSNSRIKTALQAELGDVMAEFPHKMPRWAELEKLPYLRACIKESLRLSFGIMRRLPRCSPDVDLQYKQWIIPSGTPVGMSAYMMHTDPSVFPQPLAFIPERWIGDYNPRQDRNFVAFSRGSRGCLGMQLANAEMYILAAIIFRPNRPQLHLFDTEEDDVKPTRDLFLPTTRAGSKGITVFVE